MFDGFYVNESGGFKVAGGSIAQRLLAANMDPNALRPYYREVQPGEEIPEHLQQHIQALDQDGRRFGIPLVTRNQGGAHTPSLTQNATLRKDEWKELDRAVMTVRQERLRGFDDLINAGLVYNLTNPMGKTILEYEEMTGKMDAILSMSGEARGESDKPNFSIAGLPLPIQHADFQIDARTLAASRNVGDSMDTTQTTIATRAVLELQEEMLFTDYDYDYGGRTIYSYINHPDINTGTLGADWSDSSTTGKQILADTRVMIQALLNAKQFGNYVMYIASDIETKMDEDYTTNYPRTIRERLMAMNAISDIRVVDKLPAGAVLLVRMASDVVRLVNGMAPTPVEWESKGGFVTNFKILAIQIPQIRSSPSGQSGIAYYTAP
jgi:hypothetical protein